jgi:hypothetical protein
LTLSSIRSRNRLIRRARCLRPGPRGPAWPPVDMWTLSRAVVGGRVSARDRRASWAWSRCQTPSPHGAGVRPGRSHVLIGAGKQERSAPATVVFGQMRNGATVRDDRLRTLDGLRWRNLGLIGEEGAPSDLGQRHRRRRRHLGWTWMARLWPNVDADVREPRLAVYSCADRADRFVLGGGIERSSRPRWDVA